MEQSEACEEEEKEKEEEKRRLLEMRHFFVCTPVRIECFSLAILLFTCFCVYGLKQLLYLAGMLRSTPQASALVAISPLVPIDLVQNALSATRANKALVCTK